jgi:hypothetical protein
MLCRTPPFVSDDALELIHAQIARPPAPILDRRPDTPPILVTLVETLLQKDPDHSKITNYLSFHMLLEILSKANQILSILIEM